MLPERPDIPRLCAFPAPPCWLLAKLDIARDEGIDITADIYPYEYWQSYMYVLLPERERSSREEVEFALGDLAPPEAMLFSKFDAEPVVVGKTLAEIAELREVDGVTAFMQLYHESRAVSSEDRLPADEIIVRAMLEEDILAAVLAAHQRVHGWCAERRASTRGGIIPPRAGALCARTWRNAIEKRDSQDERPVRRPHGHHRSWADSTGNGR